MSSKPETDIIDLFEIPVVRLDGELHISGMNDRFRALFGAVEGQQLAGVSDDFNARKFARKIASGEPYKVTLVPPTMKRSQFALELRRDGNGFLGYAIDTSEVAKAEAMLASYSALIERQNKEIKAKTAQVNLWRGRIQNELDQAATVQDLLVPKRFCAPCLDSRCEPVQELSGDFHEMATHDDGQITFISGDVAGKGIYAAIMLAQTLTAFRASVHHEKLTDIVVRIVTMLEDRFPDGLFVALTLVRLSADRQTFSILNLGNPDALLLDDQGAQMLIPSVGPAIGILPAAIYADLDIGYHHLTGKRLYVFTDGVLDINLGDGHSGFADSGDVGRYLAGMEAKHREQLLDRMMERIRHNSQSDDITIACFNAGSGS